MLYLSYEFFRTTDSTDTTDTTIWKPGFKNYYIWSGLLNELTCLNLHIPKDFHFLVHFQTHLYTHLQVLDYSFYRVAMNDLSNIILAPFLVLCLSLVFDRKVTVLFLSAC